jgi:hypothetical protein
MIYIDLAVKVVIFHIDVSLPEGIHSWFFVLFFVFNC